MNLKHKNIMKRNMIKAALFAEFAFVASYGVYTSQKETSMSELAMENVEALAQSEGSDRPDCVSASDMCSELVIYPDGWGENILLDHAKKIGWL